MYDEHLEQVLHPSTEVSTCKVYRYVMKNTGSPKSDPNNVGWVVPRSRGATEKRHPHRCVAMFDRSWVCSIPFCFVLVILLHSLLFCLVCLCFCALCVDVYQAFLLFFLSVLRTCRMNSHPNYYIVLVPRNMNLLQKFLRKIQGASWGLYRCFCLPSHQIRRIIGQKNIYVYSPIHSRWS